MQDKVLLSVTVITDDSTGLYNMGDLDFGLPMATRSWLEEGNNRERLADYLEWLAGQCRNKQTPFKPPMVDKEVKQVIEALRAAKL